MATYYHANVLPWTVLPHERELQRKIVLWVSVYFLIVSFIIPVIPVQKPDILKQEELPPRFARLIVDKPKPKPVVKPPVIKKEEKKPEKKKEKPKEKKKEKPKKVDKPKPKEKEPKPKPKTKKKIVKKPPPKKPKINIEAARRKAAKTGLLAFADDLADLREVPTTRLSRNISVTKRGRKSTTRSDPSLLTTTAKTGVSVDATRLTRATTGGRKLASRTTEQVDSPVEKSSEKLGRVRDRASLPRTLEKIQLVFERYKGVLNRMHSMALRRDPTLEGKVVLKITILASGAVGSCKVIDSDFDGPSFLRKVEVRCKSFDFGQAKGDMTIEYPLDFIPLS